MSKDSRAPFREKQRGGGMLKPRQPSLSCTNIPSFAPGLVYGRMGQFMAEMRCQIFYNLAEHQTQSATPRTSHGSLPCLASLLQVCGSCSFGHGGWVTILGTDSGNSQLGCVQTLECMQAITNFGFLI